MKRPSILGGIAFAFAVAVMAVPGWWLLKSILPFGEALRCYLTLAYLSYAGYLLWISGKQTGIVTLALANVTLAAVVSLLPLTIYTVVIVFAILLCLNRSLVRHRSLVSVALDGAIAALGLLFAGYLFFRSGSPVGSTWGFLLLQSVWVAVPARISLLTGWSQVDKNGVSTDSFTTSQRQAEAAIQRMSDYPGR